LRIGSITQTAARVTRNVWKLGFKAVGRRSMRRQQAFTG
jgi:hypothetical protein